MRTTQVFLAESILVRNLNDLILLRALSNMAADAIAKGMTQRQRETGFNIHHTRFVSVPIAESLIYNEPYHAQTDCHFHMQCYKWARRYRGPSASVGAFINGFESIQRSGHVGRSTNRKHYNKLRLFVASEVIKETRVVITTCVTAALNG